MNADFIDPLIPNVAIILVNWNNWRDCVECVDTLLALSYPSFEIFVVDNDSSDGSIERISQWCENPQPDARWRRHSGVGRLTDDAGRARQGVRYEVIDRTGRRPPSPGGSRQLTVIRSGANLGYAGGCNVGIKAASIERFDYFWFLNNDTVVHRDALSALLTRATQKTSIGIVGSTLRFYDHPDKVQAMGGSSLDTRTMSTRHIGVGLGVEHVPLEASAVEEQLAYIFGASMLVSKAFIRDVGPMEEGYFLYYEEFDWAMRGRGSYSLGYAPNSHVFHKSGASSSKILPIFSSRYYYRNRIRFFSRFFPGHMGAVKRGLAFDMIRHTLRGEWGKARVVAGALWDAGRLACQQTAPMQRCPALSNSTQAIRLGKGRETEPDVS